MMIQGDDMRFSRTELLAGHEGAGRLHHATVAVFGIGGVGSYALEAIARAGVGNIVIVDFDTVEISNVNRQLIALDSTIGRPKVEAAAARLVDINPDVHVTALNEYISSETLDGMLRHGVEYAVDAIDTLEPKIHLIQTLLARGIPFVSCMGSARSIDPCSVEVCDISETKNCPHARTVRRKLRECGVYKGVRCVYSSDRMKTAPLIPANDEDHRFSAAPEEGRRPMGTISYVPGIIGLTAAGLILQDILFPQGRGKK